jgi:maltose alpha-D-glucosyltransferase/alpha-amylase
LYGYQAVNVLAQERSAHSLLNWMRRLIKVRKQSAVFSRGSITFLNPTNHRVLGYLRTYEREQVLVVNNLAGSVQAVELNLKSLAGFVPIEMFDNSVFPRIGELPYLLTLGPYAFYWFRLRRI